MNYNLVTPLPQKDIDQLKIYDTVTITGKIYAGRDAVLPKVIRCIEEGTLEEHGIELQGNVVFHTAVSCAGAGPGPSGTGSSLPGPARPCPTAGPEDGAPPAPR